MGAGSSKPTIPVADAPAPPASTQSPARRIAVVAGILWDGGRFLAVERPQGKPQAGFWEFPGGKIEPGEAPADALARELREELGVTPVQAAFWRTVRHDYPHLSVELHFFHVTGFTGTVTALEGHRFAWLTWDQAMRLPFLEADLPLVADLLDGPVPGGGPGQGSETARSSQGNDCP